MAGAGYNKRRARCLPCPQLALGSAITPLFSVLAGLLHHGTAGWRGGCCLSSAPPALMALTVGVSILLLLPPHRDAVTSLGLTSSRLGRVTPSVRYPSLLWFRCGCGVLPRGSCAVRLAPSVAMWEVVGSSLGEALQGTELVFRELPLSRCGLPVLPSLLHTPHHGAILWDGSQPAPPYSQTLR